MSQLYSLDLLNISMEILLALIVAVKMPLMRIKVFFTLAALASALWHFSVSQGYQLDWAQATAELLRYFAWLMLLIELVMLSRANRLPHSRIWPLYGFFALLLIFYWYAQAYLSGQVGFYWFMYCGIFVCLLLIVVCEQLVRHDHSSRMSKLVALAAFTLFAYDVFVFSSTLLAPAQAAPLWQARTEISSATAFILAIGSLFYARQLKERSRIQLSHSFILFNTSLTLAGAFFIVMALFVSAVRYFEIDWLIGARISLYVIAVFIVVALFFAENTRHKISVWVSKHLFAHKYDYKRQWITLDSVLSTPHAGKNSYDQALLAFCKLFSCYGGGLWLKGPQFYSQVSNRRLPFEEGMLIKKGSEIIGKMEQLDWVYPLNREQEKRDRNQDPLPPWLTRIPDAWVMVPLNSNTSLIGFVVLCKRHIDEPLSWEDLDLLKLTGRQLASYIRSQQAFEKLYHNQQFEMFNKLTAFAIHDIKNLVAQQSLVVKNAAKFKHKPEFIEDAIQTIAASVTKMEKLLIKLKSNTVDDNAQACLQHTLNELVEAHKNAAPAIKLSQPDDPLMLKIDKDKLLMVLSHILSNAIDACDENDEIDIQVETETSGVWVRIQDTGCGMSEEFLKSQLFRPFNSTKEDKGMGLGAYQIRELIHQHNGELLVSSKPGEGSEFAIFLPLKEKFSETQSSDL